MPNIEKPGGKNVRRGAGSVGVNEQTEKRASESGPLDPGRGAGDTYEVNEGPKILSPQDMNIATVTVRGATLFQDPGNDADRLNSLVRALYKVDTHPIEIERLQNRIEKMQEEQGRLREEASMAKAMIAEIMRVLTDKQGRPATSGFDVNDVNLMTWLLSLAKRKSPDDVYSLAEQIVLKGAPETVDWLLSSEVLSDRDRAKLRALADNSPRSLLNAAEIELTPIVGDALKFGEHDVLSSDHIFRLYNVIQRTARLADWPVRDTIYYKAMELHKHLGTLIKAAEVRINGTSKDSPPLLRAMIALRDFLQNGSKIIELRQALNERADIYRNRSAGRSDSDDRLAELNSRIRLTVKEILDDAAMGDKPSSEAIIEELDRRMVREVMYENDQIAISSLDVNDVSLMAKLLSYANNESPEAAYHWKEEIVRRGTPETVDWLLSSSLIVSDIEQSQLWALAENSLP